MNLSSSIASLLPLFAALITSGLLFASSMLDVSAHSNSVQHEQDSTKQALQLRAMSNHLSFARICDTVYVLGDRFIEVNLRTQHATLRYRNGDSMLIPISTGNISITDAISTPTGIYSIQNKSPEAISRQFDNTKMVWWIGFNYNVGFHGLEKNHYYRYLGVRPSSHGCVRTGREDVQKLYSIVDVGDPVIVYDTVPARILAFADPISFDTAKSLALGSRTKHLAKLMSDRLSLLYKGERIAQQQFSVYLPTAYQLRPGGYQTGNRDSVLNAQVPPTTIAVGFTPSVQDALYRSLAFDENRALIRTPQAKNTILTLDPLQTPSQKFIYRKMPKKAR